MDHQREIEPNEVIQLLQEYITKIEKKNAEYIGLGKTKAEKVRIFNIEFAKQQLLLKNKGMATTILKAQTMGRADVSMLNFKVDAAEAEYAACREALHAMQEILGTYRSFLTWLRMEYKGQNVPSFHP